MRFVALALILASLPVFIALLRKYPHRRAWAVTAIAAAFFFNNIVPMGTYLYAWALWPGPVRGLSISLLETLSLALILTRSRSWRLPFWGVFAFYGFTLLLSIIPAKVPVAAMFACWQFMTLLLLFTAIGGECRYLEARRALIAGMSIGGIVQAGFVIHQKLTGAIQASGSFGHQNMLGMMVELALLPMIASLLAGDRRKIVIAGTIAFLIVVAGGGSRGTVAFAGAGAALLLFLSLARSRTPAKLRVAAVGVLALAVAAPLTVATLQERFGSVSAIAYGDESRAAMERAARAISSDHPMGIGANQYVTVANENGYSLRAGVEWGGGNLGAPVHNAYLLARAETGWLGFFAISLMLIYPTIRGLIFAFSKRSGPDGEIVLGSAIALFVNIVHNNFEYALHVYFVTALVIINISVIAAVLQSHKSGRGSRASRLPATAAARPRAFNLEAGVTPGLPLTRQPEP